MVNPMQSQGVLSLELTISALSRGSRSRKKVLQEKAQKDRQGGERAVPENATERRFRRRITR